MDQDGDREVGGRQGDGSSHDQEQLDAALDAALDELDLDEETDAMSAQRDSRRPQGSQAERPVLGPQEMALDTMGSSLDAMMKQLLQAGDNCGENVGMDSDEALSTFLKDLQSKFEMEMNQTDDKPQRKLNPSTPQSTPKSNRKESETVRSQGNVDRTISNLVEQLSSTTTDDNNLEFDQVESGEVEDMMKEMMKEFEKMGGQFQADDVIDGMMQQLLSKELMYEPMKQVTDKFPKWLEDNKGKLSDEEHKKRTEQFHCFQQLIHVYETEPENSGKLMDLMQEVQEYGQPPAEIIQDIAPGLEFDPEGIPNLDGLGGLPFSGNEECTIM